MKLIKFLIIFLSMPVIAVAQEPATSSSPQAISQRNADASLSHTTPLELNALYGRSSLIADPDRIANKQPTDQSNHGVMDQWRDRMVGTLSQYVSSRQQAQEGDGRLLSNSVPDDDQARTVTRLMAKETLKFTREHIPEIDAFVNAMKVEITSEKTGAEEIGDKIGVSKAENKISGNKAGEARSSKETPVVPVVQNKLFYKTGVRVRVDSGKVGLVSETEAKYGQASYFFKVNLDNQGDNSLGLRYALGRATSLQVERDFTQTMNPATRDKPSVNVIRLGFIF
jgi:hypothetical protein